MDLAANVLVEVLEAVRLEAEVRRQGTRDYPMAGEAIFFEVGEGDVQARWAVELDAHLRAAVPVLAIPEEDDRWLVRVWDRRVVAPNAMDARLFRFGVLAAKVEPGLWHQFSNGFGRDRSSIRIEAKTVGGEGRFRRWECVDPTPQPDNGHNVFEGLNGGLPRADPAVQDKRRPRRQRKDGGGWNTPDVGFVSHRWNPRILPTRICSLMSAVRSPSEIGRDSQPNFKA